MLEELLKKGLHLVSKIRKSMNNRILLLSDKLKLMKRGSIEAVNDILISVCDIDHTRHRNPINALVHILSGFTAYTFLEQKNTEFSPTRINA